MKAMLIRITSLQHFTVRFGNECDPPSDQVQRSEMLGQPKKIACLQRLQSGTFEFVGLSGGTTDNQIAVLNLLPRLLESVFHQVDTVHVNWNTLTSRGTEDTKDWLAFFRDNKYGIADVEGCVLEVQKLGQIQPGTITSSVTAWARALPSLQTLVLSQRAASRYIDHRHTGCLSLCSSHFWQQKHVFERGAGLQVIEGPVTYNTAWSDIVLRQVRAIMTEQDVLSFQTAVGQDGKIPVEADALCPRSARELSEAGVEWEGFGGEDDGEDGEEEAEQEEDDFAEQMDMEEEGEDPFEDYGSEGEDDEELGHASSKGSGMEEQETGSGVLEEGKGDEALM